MDIILKNVKMACSLIQENVEDKKMSKEILSELFRTVISHDGLLVKTFNQILKSTVQAKTLEVDKTKDGWLLLEDAPAKGLDPRKWKPRSITGDTYTRVCLGRIRDISGYFGQRHAEALVKKKPRWDIGLYTGNYETDILFPFTLWYSPQDGLMMPYVFTRDWKMDFVSANAHFDYEDSVLITRR